MTRKKTGLKRGLDALLASKKPASTDSKSTPEATQEPIGSNVEGDLRHMPVEFLQRGKYQPRKDMTDVGLDELAESIKAQGVIQPIVIRPIGENKYEIIAGERRWRAAQRAELAEVPVIIKDVEDDAAIAMALIENIQREDLNAIEEAQALSRLMEEFELTHQEVAEAVGKSRTTVTNLLRLLSLNPDTRILLERGDIDMGHARALLSLTGEQQSQAARTVVAKGLSVRETENLVRKLLNPAKKQEKPEKSRDVERLEIRLSDQIGSPVHIDHNAKGKGKLVIQYSSLDELDGILQNIGADLDN